jgi:hypothetical protein
MQHHFAYPKVTELQKGRPASSSSPPTAAPPSGDKRGGVAKIAFADDAGRSKQESW